MFGYQKKTDLIEGVIKYKREIRDIMLEWFIPNNCIASTAVFNRLFYGYNLPYFPLSCGYIAMNKAMLDAYKVLIQQADPSSLKDEELMQYLAAAKMGEGAYSVGVSPHGGVDRAAKTWAGHLATVVICGEDAYFVDLAVEAASRPNENIFIDPVALRFESLEVLKGNVVVDLPNGGLIIYTPAPKNRGYSATIDWKRPIRELDLYVSVIDSFLYCVKEFGLRGRQIAELVEYCKVLRLGDSVRIHREAQRQAQKGVV